MVWMNNIISRYFDKYRSNDFFLIMIKDRIFMMERLRTLRGDYKEGR